jgi:hypothetical protein
MKPYIAEIPSEQLLHRCAAGRIQRPTGGPQYLVHDPRRNRTRISLDGPALQAEAFITTFTALATLARSMPSARAPPLQNDS